MSIAAKTSTGWPLTLCYATPCEVSIPNLSPGLCRLVGCSAPIRDVRLRWRGDALSQYLERPFTNPIETGDLHSSRQISPLDVGHLAKHRPTKGRDSGMGARARSVLTYQTV